MYFLIFLPLEIFVSSQCISIIKLFTHSTYSNAMIVFTRTRAARMLWAILLSSSALRLAQASPLDETTFTCAVPQVSPQNDVSFPAPISQCQRGVLTIPHQSRSYFPLPIERLDPTDCDPNHDKTDPFCQSFTRGAYFLSGRILEFDVDLSATNCGCNAAMYLVSMPQNSVRNDCGDYYCDANGVCGSELCTEIDIMEANKVAWKSVTHHKYDRGGISGGWGRWISPEAGDAFYLVENLGKRDFECMYGPSVDCAINTNFVFHAAFVFDDVTAGAQYSYDTILSQDGRKVRAGPIRYTQPSPYIEGRQLSPEAANQRIADSVEAGLQLVASYWGGPNMNSMAWMDSPCEEWWCEQDVFTNKTYPWICKGDGPSKCETSYRISNLRVVDPNIPVKTFYDPMFNPGNGLTTDPSLQQQAAKQSDEQDQANGQFTNVQLNSGTNMRHWFGVAGSLLLALAPSAVNLLLL